MDRARGRASRFMPVWSRWTACPSPDATQIYAHAAAEPPGTPVRYAFEKWGRTSELTVPTMRFMPIDYWSTAGLLTVNGWLYFVAAALVFFLQPADPRRRCLLRHGDEPHRLRAHRRDPLSSARSLGDGPPPDGAGALPRDPRAPGGDVPGRAPPDRRRTPGSWRCPTRSGRCSPPRPSPASTPSRPISVRSTP